MCGVTECACARVCDFTPLGHFIYIQTRAWRNVYVWYYVCLYACMHEAIISDMYVCIMRMYSTVRVYDVMRMTSNSWVWRNLMSPISYHHLFPSPLLARNTCLTTSGILVKWISSSRLLGEGYLSWKSGEVEREREWERDREIDVLEEGREEERW